MSRPRKASEGSLSSGRRLGAGLKGRKRPALAADSVDGGAVAPSAPEPRVISTLGRGLVGLIVVGAILIGSAWLLVGLTVLPIVRVEGTPWAVKWAAWPEGSAPANSVVLTDENGRQTDLVSRFNLLVSDSATLAVMQVIAGPGSDIAAGLDRRIVVNGLATEWLYPSYLPPTKLGDQYLAVCLTGSRCERGSTSLVPIGNVLGEVLGSLRAGFSLGPLPLIEDDESVPGLSPEMFPAPLEPSPSQSASASPSPSSTAPLNPASSPAGDANGE